MEFLIELYKYRDKDLITVLRSIALSNHASNSNTATKEVALWVMPSFINDSQESTLAARMTLKSDILAAYLRHKVRKD